jgi:hypothetical protein
MELLIDIRRAAARIGIRTHAVLTTFCLILVPCVAVAETESVEYSVKAAYLAKFGIYVEWPGTAFSTPGSAFSLCVVGDDPFGATLDTAVAGQRIDGRPIQVRRLKTAGRDSACHILYIGNVETARAAQIAESVRGSAVLTVSDARSTGNGVGVINFVLRDNRVRFNIDEDAATQNGLNISSKLLGLALAVKSKQGKESVK